MASVSTVNTESAPSVCVVPLYSSMDVTGTASIETLIQETVTMAYDLSYNATLTEAASAKIANAFKVSGGATNFKVDMDAAAKADFIAALQAAIDVATDPASLTLQKTLYNDALATLKTVWADALANVLESNWSLNVTVDSANGAKNMQEDLADAGAVDARRAIAAQLPESNFALYMDGSENPVTAALPLKNEDVIVFLFDVATDLISRANSKVNGAGNAPVSGPSSNTATPEAGAPAGSANAGTVGDVAGSGYTQPYGTGLVQKYSGRKDIVAFFLKVSGTGAGGKINGLSAAPAEQADLIASGSGPALGF